MMLDLDLLLVRIQLSTDINLPLWNTVKNKFMVLNTTLL